MKRLDTTMDTQTGKFIDRAKPIGTVTEAMVIQRAKEIAVIKGREGNDYTREDFEEARRELVGLPNAEATDAESDAPDTGGWLQPEAGDRGRRMPSRPASDEQTFAEDLVKEGVAEATHHSMLAGSEERKRQDEA